MGLDRGRKGRSFGCTVAGSRSFRLISQHLIPSPRRLDFFGIVLCGLFRSSHFGFVNGATQRFTPFTIIYTLSCKKVYRLAVCRNYGQRTPFEEKQYEIWELERRTLIRHNLCISKHWTCGFSGELFGRGVNCLKFNIFAP